MRGREIERVLFVEEEPGVEVGAENSPGRGDHTEGRVAVDLLRGLRRGGVGLGIDREEVVADHVIDQGKIVVGHVIDQESIAVDHVIDQGEVVADQKRGPGKEGADQGKGQRVKIKGKSWFLSEQLYPCKLLVTLFLSLLLCMYLHSISPHVYVHTYMCVFVHIYAELSSCLPSAIFRRKHEYGQIELGQPFG